MNMKSNVTVLGVLGILITPIIIVLSWGISVSVRLGEHEQMIKDTKAKIEKVDAKAEKTDDKVDENYKIIGDKLDQILIKLGEKADRTSK